MSETCPRRAPQVLPYEADARSRFVLKLHGDLRRPQDIVLTRAQLSGAREQRAALSGVVQGLLMTKHLCFVGFSLQDPNFSEVAPRPRLPEVTREHRDGPPHPFSEPSCRLQRPSAPLSRATRAPRRATSLVRSSRSTTGPSPGCGSSLPMTSRQDLMRSD